MRASHALAAAVALLPLATAPAGASPVSYDVGFSVNTFTAAFGGAVPVDPVTGSFTITFDPTLTYTNSTAGIALNSLNITLGSSLSFNYNPAADGSFAAGTLRVGGLFNGADQIQYSPPTDDFWLYIQDFAGTPTFQQLGYVQSTSAGDFYFTLAQTASLRVTPSVVVAASEPASLLVVLAGLAGLGVLRRRRT
jgi:hypothetical protein